MAGKHKSKIKNNQSIKRVISSFILIVLHRDGYRYSFSN